MLQKKDYTAEYSTENVKNIKYSFRAENLSMALEYAKRKFTDFPNIAIRDDEQDKIVFQNGKEIE
jgi:hypothetical protein